MVVPALTRRILGSVLFLPYSGHSTAAAPVRSERKTTFSESDREVIRKHIRARSVERERPTTGSTFEPTHTGERVPEGVEIEAFPDEVYREAPTLREYRYINRDRERQAQTSELQGTA